MSKIATLVVSLASLGILFGCAPDGQPTRTQVVGSQPALVASSEATGLDGLFLRVSDLDPSFAGAWFDSAAGGIVIAHTGGGVPSHVNDAFTQALGGVAPFNNLRIVANKTVAHSFAALVEWKNEIRGIAGEAQIISLDADEFSNTVAVGVASEDRIESTGLRIESLGIPKASFHVTVVARMLPRVSLQDKRRPSIENGFQVSYQSGVSQFLCTLGADVYAMGVKGFVTAGHCAGGGLGTTGSTIHQNVAINSIGSVAINPTGFTGGICPATYQCRYSDVEWVQYSPSSLYSGKKIAETTVIGSGVPGSLTFSLSRVALGSSNLITGLTVRKTGRTSGTTTGSVLATCVDLPEAGTTYWLLCQDQVSDYSAGGDSGAPVYVLFDGTAYHAGILWGGDSAHTKYTLSNWIGVSNEMPVYY